MTLEDQVFALRHSVAMSRLEHVRSVRLTGTRAYEAADRLFTRDLYLRDGQLSQGLLLNEDATIFADCYLGSDDEDFFFLAEGPDSEDLMAHLNRELADEVEVEAVHETLDHTIIGLDGPYAWELMSLLVGPEVIGLPYLTFFRTRGILCYRAGKTGEFGYRLVVPDDMLEEMSHRLQDLGAPLDLGSASLEALDQCALDNWFFNIRGEGRHGSSPIELQLQWRVSYRKSFVGSDALAARRSEGIRQRVTCIVCEDSLKSGDAVTLDATRIGTVAHAAFSPIRNQWVALALLDLDHAYPGIDRLRIGSNNTTGITVSPPVLDNRSLYVNPQIHSYQSRDEFDFPPVRPT